MRALEVRALTHRYRRGLFGVREETAALQGVDLYLDEGEILGLIGESGCGKTTLARCIGGLVRPESGQITCLGQDIKTTRTGRLRSSVQLLFQSPMAHLNPELSVEGHLLESARLHRPQEEPHGLVLGALSRFSLRDRSQALPHQLSGGEQRRVSLARVMLADPRLLIADEPTSGLDAALKADLIDLLLTEGPTSRSILLISHDLPVVLRACTRICVMLAGQIIEDLPADGFVENASHPYTQSLLASAGLRGGDR